MEIINSIKLHYKDGFFHILIGNTLIKMIGFISSIVIIRLVVREEYAHLAYANNLYAYIALFSGLGMSISLLKFCSSSSNKELDRAYFKFALKFGFIMQLFLAIILNLYVFFGNLPFPEAKVLVALMIFIPGLAFIVETIQSYIRSLEKNRLYSAIALSQSSIVFILSVVFVLLIGIKGIPVAQYIAIITVIFIALPSIKRELGGVKKVKLSNKQVKIFLSMGVSLMVANLFSMMMPINEMLLVNYLIRSEAATANYRIAMLIPSQLGFITGSIMVYYFPKIAKMKDNKEILRTAINIQIVAGIIIFSISIVGFLFSPLIINYLYGSQYEDSLKISRLFWVVFGLNAGFRMIPMNIMPALGRVKFNASIAIISTLFHFVASYLLIYNFGIQGSAIALLFIYGISGIVSWVYLIFIIKKQDNANISFDV